MWLWYKLQMFLYRSPCGKLSLPAAAGGQNILLTASYSLEFSDVLYETSPPLRIFESPSADLLLIGWSHGLSYWCVTCWLVPVNILKTLVPAQPPVSDDELTLTPELPSLLFCKASQPFLWCQHSCVGVKMSVFRPCSTKFLSSQALGFSSISHHDTLEWSTAAGETCSCVCWSWNFFWSK